MLFVFVFLLCFLLLLLVRLFVILLLCQVAQRRQSNSQEIRSFVLERSWSQISPAEGSSDSCFNRRDHHIKSTFPLTYTSELQYLI
jgi:hypothetical protein